MAEFAKMIKMDEDEFFALTYPEACALVGQYGYEFTGSGILPIPKSRANKKNRKLKQ